MRRRRFIALTGAAALGQPAAARAQQAATTVIGFLHPAFADGYRPYVAALRQSLAEMGYVEGRNLTIEFRWGESHNDRLPLLAAELVQLRPAAIIAGGNDAAVAAKHATTTIPIVFSMGADPVQLGLVASFARPGANVTGMLQFTGDLLAKRLEMLRDLLPKATVIGLLFNPQSTVGPSLSAELQAVARATGLQVRRLGAASREEFEAAFATGQRENIDALLVQSTPLFTNGQEQLVALAARYRMPASYGYREAAVAGGLMSYGSSNTDAYRQVGLYIGRILKGEKPAEMPVVRPTKFELVINMRTAKELGLTVPPTLLVFADEVIE